jgi:hypothetical protein
MITFLLSFLFLSVGLIMGWLGAERYIQLLAFERHDFEELFEENPHPEIFNKDGEVNRGDYMYINFDLGYDPEEFDPEDVIEE